jgi:hypothetical protein
MNKIRSAVLALHRRHLICFADDVDGTRYFRLTAPTYANDGTYLGGFSAGSPTSRVPTMSPTSTASPAAGDAKVGQHADVTASIRHRDGGVLQVAVNRASDKSERATERLLEKGQTCAVS